MASHEAEADGIESYAKFPDENQKRLVVVNITDVHGNDITVEEVKKELLLLKNITTYHKYALLGGDDSNCEILYDNDLITKYDKYLSPSTEQEYLERKSKPQYYFYPTEK